VRPCALAAALCAAAFLPGEPLGAGVIVVALLVAGAAVAAARPAGRTVALGAAALALASFAAVRDAGWVVMIDLAAAWLIASVALGGARLAALWTPAARLSELRGLAPRSAGRFAPAVRGSVLGGFLVVPFAALFAAADAAFAELGSRIPLPSVGSLPARIAIFALVLLAALALALAARRPPQAGRRLIRGRLAPLEWAIPLAALVVLFVAFVTVQLAVLFGGHDHVLQTAGLTYAEYARQGFWELLVAAALTLSVVVLAVAFATTPARAHRLLLRALLGALCALTLVVLASALHRLRLYEDAYGLTRLRLGAEAIALWLGGAFGLALLAGLFARVRRRTAELAVAGSAAALIAFSFANPDGRIAARNVEHWRETGRIDLDYLAGLSADAVPELAELPEPTRTAVLAPIAARLEDDEPWSSANLARARARGLLSAKRLSAAPVPRRSRSEPPPRPARTRSGTAR
jgi:Domain of unknown function (DUF4173)